MQINYDPSFAYASASGFVSELTDIKIKKETLRRLGDEISNVLRGMPKNFSENYALGLLVRVQFIFDYLLRTKAHPDTFLEFIENIRLEINAFELLGQSGGFSGSSSGVRELFDRAKLNVFDRTSFAFDFMWTQNTSDQKQFDESMKMVRPRVEEILLKLPESLNSDASILEEFI